MASMSGAHTLQADLVRGTIAEVKLLTVERLKRVLKNEQLTVSGVKNELQMRLIAHIDDFDRRNDQDRLRRIRDVVRAFSGAASNSQYNTLNPYPSPYSNSNHTPTSSASPQYNYTSPTPRLPPPASLVMPASGHTANPVTFKTSPFYTVQRPLSNIIELKTREQTRDTAHLTINLDDATAATFQNDPACKAMVFCAAESYDSAWKPVDIAFPQHAELRCNQDEVKANLKGLKNKPGSTRPVDITSFLRKKPAFPNNIQLVYALTNKAPQQKYFLLVNLVQAHPIKTLVEELKRGKFLSRDRVIREMQAKANDDDIVATSSNMSLRDPVQMTRIETPCRSVACKHTECFDAAVYLALQEQAPTWTCPICSKPAAWDSLVFDQFVQDILQNTTADVEQVSIEPDGQWHLIKADDGIRDDPTPHGKRHGSDEDDDLVEISNLEAPKTIASIRTRPSADPFGTPPLNRTTSFPLPLQPLSSESPSQSVNSLSLSRKRPREEVIDLTLSDDDDEPPVSRIKRPSLSSQVSADNNRQGVPTGTFRCTLPPPIPRTDSPGIYFNPLNFGF